MANTGKKGGGGGRTFITWEKKENPKKKRDLTRKQKKKGVLTRTGWGRHWGKIFTTIKEKGKLEKTDTLESEKKKRHILNGQPTEKRAAGAKRGGGKKTYRTISKKEGKEQRLGREKESRPILEKKREFCEKRKGN